MSRKPNNRDDSDEIPLPSDAEVNRILSAVIPQTPERLKERTRATHGQDFASYNAQGAPAKARRADTLDVAGPVITDDTNVDGLRLSENTIQQIEAEREEEAQRNDSTISVDRPLEKKKKWPMAVLLLAMSTVAIGVVVFTMWRVTKTSPDPPNPSTTQTTLVSSSMTPPRNTIELPVPSGSATTSAIPVMPSIIITMSAGSRSAKPPAVAAPTSGGTTSSPHIPTSAVSSRPDIAGSP